MSFWLAYIPFNLVHLKGHGQEHFDWILQTIKIELTLLLSLNMKQHVGFWLAYFDLTLAYSKGQLGSCNGVLPNIFSLLIFYYN